MIRRLLAVIGIGFFIFMALGYQRAHTSEFKVRCALEQAGMGDMNVADGMLCRTFYRLN